MPSVLAWPRAGPLRTAVGAQTHEPPLAGARFSCSIGVHALVAAAGGAEPPELVRGADEALQADKEAGRNQVLAHLSCAGVAAVQGREALVASSARGTPRPHSTVTLLAKLRGLSTSVPRAQAVW